MVADIEMADRPLDDPDYMEDAIQNMIDDGSQYFIDYNEIIQGNPTEQQEGNAPEQQLRSCGYLVRDQIPISAREWRDKRGASEITFVSDRDKEVVWKAVAYVFTFDTNDEELKVRIYDWTMKKMALLFQNWKKTLYNKFVRKTRLQISTSSNT